MRSNKQKKLFLGVFLLLFGIFLIYSVINLDKKIPNEEKNYCAIRGDVCTKEYRPVCGWFSQQIQCIKYPCANTYSNPCMACSDEQVEYWIEGECPTLPEVY